MKCEKCQKKTEKNLENAGKHYCEKHYQEIIEKRIRKYLRTKKKINTKKEYNLKGPKEEKELLKKILEGIFNGRLKITNKKTNNTITTSTADQEAEKLIEQFLTNKDSQTEKEIKPLSNITEKEISNLKKIYRIKKIDKIKPKKLDELEKKYPGTKFSIIKTKEFLEKKTKK